MIWKFYLFKNFKWEVLWGPIFKKLHDNDGIWILTTISKRRVAGSLKTALLDGWMDGWMQVMEKSVDTRAVR